jgi:hypothetical protein
MSAEDIAKAFCGHYYQVQVQHNDETSQHCPFLARALRLAKL